MTDDIEFINIFELGETWCRMQHFKNCWSEDLLDCNYGWNEKFDRALLDIVKILISHSSSMHDGALPLLFANNVDIRVIATSPVTKIWS